MHTKTEETGRGRKKKKRRKEREKEKEGVVTLVCYGRVREGNQRRRRASHQPPSILPSLSLPSGTTSTTTPDIPNKLINLHSFQTAAVVFKKTLQKASLHRRTSLPKIIRLCKYTPFKTYQAPHRVSLRRVHIFIQEVVRVQ